MVDDLQSKAAEFAKKILTVGVGAIFLTEESLRSLVAEFKLPKEFLTGILDSANKNKREFLQTLSDEFSKRVLSKVDPKEFLTEFFQNNEIDMHIKVKFSPKNEQDK
jgi:hypothetical protein